MKLNSYDFIVEGLWENKMQKILYDYILNAGPLEYNADGQLIDRHSGHSPVNYGLHTLLGQQRKSLLFDVLGYCDKEAEKWYASWNTDKTVKDTIQNADIYAEEQNTFEI